MEDPHWQRWLGIVGLVFVVLIVVSTFSTPAPPSTSDSVAKVVSYYHQHRSATLVIAYLIEVAIFVGIFFFWLLRDRLARDNRLLANIGFAGAILFAASGGVFSGLSMALGHASGHVHPSVMQSLNALSEWLPVTLAGAGVAIFLVATGAALIRSAVLPRWLGWVGIVLAVASLVLPQVAPPAAGIWILVASIVVLIRDARSVSVTAPAPVG
jgi:hypothetical protein